MEGGYKLPSADYFDTFVAARWLWPDAHQFGLEHLALRLTDIEQWRPCKKLTGLDFDTIPDSDLSIRCAGDAEASFRLYERLQDEIRALQLEPIFKLAMDALPVLAEIGGRGMAVDFQELERRVFGESGADSQGLAEWLQKEKKELEAILGIENLGSYQEREKALYTKLGAVPLRETEIGYSTDHTSILWARYCARKARNSPLEHLLTRILDYGTKFKIYSTYYRPWLNVGKAARVRSFYSLGITATGRLSSSGDRDKSIPKPYYNLQNIPAQVRDLIIPSEGYDYLCQIDFKMIELCTAGYISQDPILIKWIREDRDIHAIQAARVLGLKEPETQEEVTEFKKQYKTERQVGKRSNFASLYGVTAETLAWQIFDDSDGAFWIEPNQVQPYIDAFFNTFSGWKRHLEDIWLMIQRGEWIVSPTGRRWLFEATRAGLRKAGNYAVQSLASDLVLIFLHRVARRLRRWRTRIIGEVHDSVLFETTRHELQDLVNLVIDESQSIVTKERFGFELNVPLSIEIQVGTSWGKLQTL